MAKRKLVDVIVDRATWINGEVMEVTRCDSALTVGPESLPRHYAGREPRKLDHKPKGFQCCLGFACSVAGITKTEQTDSAFPSSLKVETYDKWLETFGDSEYNFTPIADINDHEALSRPEREKQVTEQGKHYGINFIFRGKYPAFLKKR